MMPITKLTSTSEDTDGPINYSLKTQEKTETMHSSISPQAVSQQPQMLQSHLQQDVNITCIY